MAWSTESRLEVEFKLVLFELLFFFFFFLFLSIIVYNVLLVSAEQ